MPAFIRTALEQKNLMDAYRSRPPYQRNDTIGWITRARLPATRRRRIEQMLDELGRGNTYMKMSYRPRRLGE